MLDSKLLEEVHESWMPFLTTERVAELHQIEEQIGNDYTPKRERILRFMKEDLNAKKVIWLGQDPYFTPNVANGRSFQPDNLTDWREPFKQVSLKNIIRLIHTNFKQVTCYEEIKTYKMILEEIDCGEFPILPPKEWFTSLEKQGVMFLNTSFTCTVNQPNSHKKLWEHFSKELLHYISEVRPDMIWFLWGKEAISNKEVIENGVFYESRHPMMCSVKYEDDFLKSQCFAKTWNQINWLG